MRTITITEFQTIERADTPELELVNCGAELGSDCFDKLEKVITEQTNTPIEQRFFKVIPSRVKHGFALQANNCVGYYKVSDKSAIEILPKVYTETEYTLQEQRRLLLKMLATVYDLNVQNIENVNLGNLANTHLLEIFITLFLNNVKKLCVRGLKADYQDVEENEPFCVDGY